MRARPARQAQGGVATGAYRPPPPALLSIWPTSRAGRSRRAVVGADRLPRLRRPRLGAHRCRPCGSRLPPGADPSTDLHGCGRTPVRQSMGLRVANRKTRSATLSSTVCAAGASRRDAREQDEHFEAPVSYLSFLCARQAYQETHTIQACSCTPTKILGLPTSPGRPRRTPLPLLSPWTILGSHTDPGVALLGKHADSPPFSLVPSSPPPAPQR